MIRVRVPATSANMGSGFDSIGIAFNLYNTFEMEECDGLKLSCATGQVLPKDDRNLVYACAKRVCDETGKNLRGLRLIEHCHIPMTRGLGSSSACTVAGVMGANTLLGHPLSRQDVINLCARIEGHPDNSTPAILGGFVAALLEDGQVWQVRVPISLKVHFAVFVPNFELPTERARAVLPDNIARKDAIFNLSRAALLAGSLVAGDLHNLNVATQDRLHQPYRFPLIPEGQTLLSAVQELGALGAYISGAGPSLVAIVDDLGFETKARALVSERFPRWEVLMLHCDEVGAVVTSG